MIPNAVTSQEKLRHPEDYTKMETSFGTIQNSKIDNFKEKFKQRLYNFALKLIEFLDNLPKDNVSKRIGDQLLRSGAEIILKANQQAVKESLLTFLPHL